MASALPALPARGRNKAEASEREMTCLSSIRMSGFWLTCSHTQPGGSAPRGEEQQGRKRIVTFGVAPTRRRQITCLPLQPSWCCRLQGATWPGGVNKGGSPDWVLSRPVMWACRAAPHDQERYLWHRPRGPICASLLLHLALPGRAPGLIYHRRAICPASPRRTARDRSGEERRKLIPGLPRAGPAGGGPRPPRG